MSARLYQQCRQILLEDWDPIGVAAFADYDPTTEDEYNGYAREIAALLTLRRDEKEIEDYLTWAAEYIGLEPNVEVARATAVRLSRIE